MHDLTRESSGVLPLRLLQFIPRFLKTLKDAAKEGRITAQSPITAKEICKRTNTKWIIENVMDELTDIDVRAMVNYLRRHGILICASSSGYWLGDEVEFRSWAGSMRRRIETMQETYDQAQHGIELREKYYAAHMEQIKKETIGGQLATELAVIPVGEEVERFFEQELMKSIEHDIRKAAA